MCPVCTVGIAAGVGLSRWLGFSDAVSGLWIGAAIFAFSIATARWLAKKAKETDFRLLFIISLAGWWILTIMPLRWTGIISADSPKILGLNDLFFGALLGVAAAKLAAVLESRIREFKNGKVVFPYQKVIIPISILVIASLALYFII